MLTLAKHFISLYVGSSGRCSTAWGQNEIFCQSKVLFPLVHACYKNLQHRSKQNPIIWAWRNRAKLNFLSDFHWLNDIEPLIALCSFSLCMCNMFCFLWPSWMKLFEVCIYIYHIDAILQQYRWHIYDILMQHQWKKRTLTVPRSQNRGLWECAFCTPLYTFSVLTYALTGKKKNKWQDSTLCILPLGHEKTQLSASFPWGLKKPKKTTKNKKKKQKTKDMPPMPTVSRNLFFCFCFLFI